MISLAADNATRFELDASRFDACDGVLLIGHGTRDADGTRQFFELGERLIARLAPVPVEPCLLELQPPTIEQGWAKLVQRGVRRVIAAPLLLFSAGHAKSDIPYALNACLQASPGMTWRESRPLSRAPELLSLLLKRLDASLAQSSVPMDNTAIVMVGRGSFDPCAQADMRLLTHWVAGQRRASIVRTAFYAMAEPRLPVVLSEVASLPSIKTVIVHPHLLFEGSLYQSILKQMAEAAEAFPSKRFIASSYLGPEPEVVDAIIRRLASAKQPRADLFLA
jgi:sirohydrochlorin cobaltochelatase